MSIDKPARNKMMTAAPTQKEYHFSGDGIWHNMTVLAETIEEATKRWLEKRQAINTATAAPLSTPTSSSSAAEGV
jgi:hypothetical protein